MKQLLKTLGRCSLFKVTYTSRFFGCQCYKDCSCMEEWLNAGNPKKITEYTVFTGKRTHRHKTLEEAEACMERTVNCQNLNK